MYVTPFSLCWSNGIHQFADFSCKTVLWGWCNPCGPIRLWHFS